MRISISCEPFKRLKAMLMLVLALFAAGVAFAGACLLWQWRRTLPNKRFVERFCSKFVSQQNLRAALLRNDRRFFCSGARDPYSNDPQPIGFNATISAPDVLCIALDLCAAAIRPGSRVLDVGCGSGFSTALLAEMAGPTGRVVGIDHIPELCALAESNIRRANRKLLRRISFVVGDGRLGVSDEAPFDVIYAAAAPQTIPKPLIAQLRPGGRLVLPFGPLNGFHQLVLVDKPLDGGVPVPKFLGNVRFVPMTDSGTQLHGDPSLHIPVHTMFYPAPDSSPQQLEEIRRRLETEWGAADE